VETGQKLLNIGGEADVSVSPPVLWLGFVGGAVVDVGRPGGSGETEDLVDLTLGSVGYPEVAHGVYGDAAGLVEEERRVAGVGTVTCIAAAHGGCA